MTKLKKSKKYFLLVFLLLLFGLAFPLKTHAFWAWLGSVLLGKLTSFFGAIISLIAKIFIFNWISSAAFNFANGLLGWVTSPTFLAGVPYTRNAFVLYGWQILRDFCNMFYILIVIAIGIGTALRLREYQIQRVIPRLIASAILINFAPTICGVIIDASNIFMQTFLAPGTQGMEVIATDSASAMSGLIGAGSELGISMGNIFMDKVVGFLFDSFITIIFNFFATFVVLALALLFLMRYLALWTAVILSPLAFIAWVLPHSSLQKIWRMWWEQFLGWCFVGIGGAFFLHLSQIMAQAIHTLVSAPGAEVGLSTQGLPGILVHLFPLTFLFIGYTLTFQYAPMGAQTVLGWVRTAQAFAGGYLIGRYGKAQRERFRKVFSRPPAPPSIAEKIERMKATQPENLEKLPRPLRKIASWGMRTAGGTLEKLFGPATREAKASDRAYIEARDRSLLENLEKLSEALRENNKAAAAGILKALAEKGELPSAMDKSKLGAAALPLEKLEDIFKYAVEMDYRLGTKMSEKILQAFAHDSGMLNRLATAMDKVTANFKPEDRTVGGLTQKERERNIQSIEEKVRASYLTNRENFETFAKNLQKLPEPQRQAVEREIFDMFRRGLIRRELFTQAGRTLGEGFISLLENELQNNPLGFYTIEPTSGQHSAWMVQWAATSPVARELGIIVPPQLYERETRERLEQIANTAKVRVRQFNLPGWNQIQQARTTQQQNQLLNQTMIAPLEELQRELLRAQRQNDVMAQQVIESAFGAIEAKARSQIRRIQHQGHARALRTLALTGARQFARSRARTTFVNIAREATQIIPQVPPGPPPPGQPRLPP